MDPSPLPGAEGLLLVQEGNQSRPVRNVQLSVDIFEVGLGGMKTDAQLGRNFLIAESLPDPTTDFLLLWGQSELFENGAECGTRIAQRMQFQEPEVILTSGDVYLKNGRAPAVPEGISFKSPGVGRLLVISDPTLQKSGQGGAEIVSWHRFEQFPEVGILVNDPRVSGDLHHRGLRFQRILIRG